MSQTVSWELAVDPALPQRDLLLDAGAAAIRLASALGWSGDLPIDRCEPWRVKYRIGVSLRVLYHIELAGQPHVIAARAFSRGTSGGHAAYRRALDHVVQVGPLRPVAYDAELETVFWTFPNDRKVAGLPMLFHNPQQRTDLLDGRWAASRLVAYAPEKSATVQCLDVSGATIAYAKVYAGNAGDQVRALYTALAQSRTRRGAMAGPRLPHVIDYLPEQRVLLLEAIPGERVADLENTALRGGLERLGGALAALHALPPPVLPRFTRVDPDRLLKAARLIAAARPAVAQPVLDLAQALAAHVPPATEQAVCLHGDVHPKNGLLADDVLALIDLDQAALGPAAADIGSLLAGLRYQHRTESPRGVAEQELARGFLDGYRSIRALPERAALRWHVAAALLAERALRAVNRIRPEGLRHLDGILADARAILDGRVGGAYDD